MTGGHVSTFQCFTSELQHFIHLHRHNKDMTEHTTLPTCNAVCSITPGKSDRQPHCLPDSLATQPALTSCSLQRCTADQ